MPRPCVDGVDARVRAIHVPNAFRFSSRRGFTLIELLVVIALIGILSAIAVPLLRTYTREAQLDGDANILFLDLQWMKGRAVVTNKKYSMTFGTATVDGTTRLTWSIYEDGNAVAKRTNSAGVGVQLGRPSGVPAPTAAIFTGIGTTLTGGLGSGVSGAAQCMETGNTDESWIGGVAACGGAVSDMETGVLYLQSSASTHRAYAIVFNRSKALSLKRFRYMGGSWEGY